MAACNRLIDKYFIEQSLVHTSIAARLVCFAAWYIVCVRFFSLLLLIYLRFFLLRVPLYVSLRSLSILPTQKLFSLLFLHFFTFRIRLRDSIYCPFRMTVMRECIAWSCVNFSFIYQLFCFSLNSAKDLID